MVRALTPGSTSKTIVFLRARIGTR